MDWYSALMSQVPSEAFIWRPFCIPPSWIDPRTPDDISETNQSNKHPLHSVSRHKPGRKRYKIIPVALPLGVYFNICLKNSTKIDLFTGSNQPISLWHHYGNRWHQAEGVVHATLAENKESCREMAKLWQVFSISVVMIVKLINIRYI